MYHLAVSVVLLLACAIAPVGGVAQVSFDSSAGERLQVNLVPIVVLETGVAHASVTDPGAFGDQLETLEPQLTTMFSSVREAMLVLGVEPDEYDLNLGNMVHFLICDEAMTLAEQSCHHSELGRLSELPDFVNELYEQWYAPQRTIQFHVVILGGGVAWRGILGKAWRWRWEDDWSTHHWTNTACRAWALHSIPVIAHELGHCFALDHNEDDPDFGLDLMVSHYSHYHWLKDSNKEVVRHHFRHPNDVEELSYAHGAPLSVTIQ